MKLLRMQVNNYKSLKAVEIDFGDLTVLTGRNSSGKSNLLEALNLFFNDFTLELTGELAGASDYLWHNRITRNPIEFVATFQLTRTEYDLFFVSEPNRKKPPFTDGKLKVHRQIASKSPETTTMTTLAVSYENSILIKDGKLVNYATDGRGGKGGKNLLTKILAKVAQLLEGRFRLIPSVRDAPGPVPHLGERSLNIPQDIHGDMVATYDSDKLSNRKVWHSIENDINQVPSLEGLNTMGGQLRNREGLIRFPLSYIGGGDQEVLALTFKLRSEKAQILAIEEPETHMHPSLSRTFFEILKKLSREKQLIITTHSPIFMDLGDLSNSWIITKEDLETKAFRLQSDVDLRTASYELGIRPSDIFFADKILFVEGPIDKTVYRIWGRKLGIDLESPRISVIPLGGKTKGKRHLQAWTEVTRNIPVTMSMILDEDAKREANELVEKDLITSTRLSILSKGAIEDYYDRNTLMNVMKKRYGKEFTEADLKPSQSEGLMKFLKKKHRDWKARSRAKYEIGEDVATQMSKERIHNDIKVALERARDSFRLA